MNIRFQEEEADKDNKYCDSVDDLIISCELEFFPENFATPAHVYNEPKPLYETGNNKLILKYFIAALILIPVIVAWLKGDLL